jgi:hypothetical protein
MNSACPIYLKGILFSLVPNEGEEKWRETISNFDLPESGLPSSVSFLLIINNRIKSCCLYSQITQYSSSL